jgi:hypothetical protein
VPANVRAKRQKVKDAPRLAVVSQRDTTAGFGLAPQLGAAHGVEGSDAEFASFMDEIAKL